MRNASKIRNAMQNAWRLATAYRAYLGCGRYLAYYCNPDF